MDSWFYCFSYDYPHEAWRGLVVGGEVAEWKNLSRLQMRGYMNHEVPYRNVPVGLMDAMLEASYG